MKLIINTHFFKYGLSLTDLAVLGAIQSLDFTNLPRYNKVLANICHISQRQVSRSLTALKSANLIFDSKSKIINNKRLHELEIEKGTCKLKLVDADKQEIWERVYKRIKKGGE